MSFSSIITKFRRLLILEVSGLMAFIALSQTEPLEAGEFSPATPSNSNINTFIPAENTNANELTFPKRPHRTVPAQTPATDWSAPQNADHSANLIFVNNNVKPQVSSDDGAIFPQSPCSVQIRRLAADSTTQLIGAPSEENTFFYGNDNTTEYFQGGLNIRQFHLSVQNGLLTASGRLTTPVLLTFNNLPSQPDILLWPQGCQASFNAQSDTNGNITITGGRQFLDCFAHLRNTRLKSAVKLYLATAAGDCATNFLVQGTDYTLDSLVPRRIQTSQNLERLQQEMLVLNAFDKLFQSNQSPGKNEPFWQSLDEHCQLFTQGRLGVTGYDFSGTEEARESARTAVLNDLAVAADLSPEIKGLVISTLTITNISTMASLVNQLAWEKSLPQIKAELTTQKNITRSSLLNPTIVGQFKYLLQDEGGTNQPTVLAQLNFSGRRILDAREMRLQEIDRQIAQLNASIFSRQQQLASPNLSYTVANQIRSEIQILESRKATLLQERNNAR